MKIKSTIIILIGVALSLNGGTGFAQTGLEKVIVEKYYVSNAADSITSIGILPVGSVTYRVFLDMKPGYKFQTAFGSPTHTLFIKTTTSFFNNEDRGAVIPSYSKTQARNNTVMLDSWLSAGAGCIGNFGILKNDDDGIGTVVNADNVLQNADTSAGIPLIEQDGLISGTPGNVTMIGIDDQVAVFDAVSQQGNSFVTTNGAWSCLSGAVGPDSTNTLLIGQFTTNGVLSFELNIQLGTPEGGTEQFVAKDASGLENQFAGLTYKSPENTSGIEQHLKETEDVLVASPNPTCGLSLLDLYTSSHYRIVSYSIFDLTGSEICSGTLNSASGGYSSHINTSNLPTGIYLVKVSMDGYSKTLRLVKD
ncbi:MAG: T9SS type A sorting domain-containing protein [Bacteroidetes bacterium]|nr:T9SS type A sorting domain-containing protein [Bacteroidota bacterium]